MKKKKSKIVIKKNDKAMQERDKEPDGFSLKPDMLSPCQLITYSPWLENIYVYIYIYMKNVRGYSISSFWYSLSLT